MSEKLKENDVEPTEPEDKKEPKTKGEDEPAWLNKLMDKLDNVLPTEKQTEGAQQVPVPNPPPVKEPEDEEDREEAPTKSPVQKLMDWLM
ncbi:hypothetical protein [Bacillus sp. WC2502]|uniref:hypothetical protein n=1 Tax=Bacillus sp. WC2502 TaxID=3461401 RepID=UPI004044930B